MLNTHGRKITGLKAAAGETQHLTFHGRTSGYLFWDALTGKVRCEIIEDRDPNKPTTATAAEYFIARTDCRLTMQEIADLIYERARG